MNQITDYWASRNKSLIYSKKLLKIFDQEIKRLSKNSQLGRVVGKDNLRLAVIRDYLLLHRITAKEIFILRIWDSRRNPEDFKKIIDLF